MSTRGLKDVLVPVQLGGMNVGADPKVLQPGELVKLENGEFARRGAISHRNGLTTLTTGHTTDDQICMMGDKVVLLGSSLKIWNAGSAAWETVGDLHRWDLSEQHLAPIAYQPGSLQVLQSAAWVAVAWTQLEGLYWRGYVRTYSRSTGRLLDSRAIGTGTCGGYPATFFPVQLVLRGSTYEWHTFGGVGEINATTGVISAGTSYSGSLTHVAGLTSTWSVCYVGGAQHTVVICYRDVDDYISCITWNDTLAIDNQWQCGAVDPQALGTCQLASGSFGLCWYDPTAPGALNAHAYTDQGAGVTSVAITLASAPLACRQICGIALSSTQIRWLWVADTASPLPTGDHPYKIVSNTWTKSGSSGVAGTAATWIEGCGIVCKPFWDELGVEWYLGVTADVPLGEAQPGYVLLNSSAVPVASWLSGYSYFSLGTEPGSAQSAGSNAWILPSITFGRTVGAALAATDPNQGSGACVATLTRGLAGCQPVDLRDRLLIPGALPQEFTGRQVVEAGFLTYPHQVSAVAQVDGGSPGALGEGVYGYVALYEWFDDAGRRYLSMASPTKSVTTDATHHSVLLTAPDLTLTRKTGVRILWFRTLLNGAVYYRLVARDVPDLGYEDKIADATIDGEETWYEQESLENWPCPPFRSGCVHGNRVYLADLEQQGRVIYSKPILPSMGLQFSAELLSHQLDAGGELTTLASYFGRLLAASADQLHLVEGQGLDDAGKGAGHASYQLSAGIGCTDQRTAVQVPEGMLFLSRNGLRLLDRQLQVQPVGDPARYYTDTLTLVRGVYRQRQQSVRWLSATTALEQSLRFGLWGTHSGHGALGAVVDSSGLLWVLGTDAKVKCESAGAASDDSVDVVLSIDTGPISFAGLGGIARVRRMLVLGYGIGEHVLHVQFAYNGDPYWQDDQTLTFASPLVAFDWTALLGAGSSANADQAYIVEAQPSVQRNVTSIRARIYEVASGRASQRYSIVAIAFVVAVKPGSFQLDAARGTVKT